MDTQAFLNPYVNGNIIQKDWQFYNRTNFINLLTNLDSRAHYVKGNRRIGKTSLLRQIQRRLGNNSGVIPLYLNLEGTKNLYDIQKFFQRALKEACKLAKVEAFQCPEDFLEAFACSLEACSALGFQYFLLIDEAEQLLHLPTNVLSIFHREITNTHDNLTVVISATNRLQELYHYDIEGANFLDNFSIHHIGCLSREGAIELICQSQHPNCKLDIPSSVINDIIFYAGTHPYLIQRLCFNLFEKNTLRDLSEQDLVLDKSLRNFFEVDFKHLDDLQKQILLQFEWQKKLSVEAFEKISRPTLNAALKELKELGFLYHDIDQYTLSNYFLAQWLEEKRLELNPEKKTSLTIKNPPMPKLNVFISYAHKDEAFKEALDTHLTMLKRSDKIATWNDRAILAGTEWDDEIKEQLEQAQIIILLVSASFLASKYIWENELTLAMEWHKRKEVRIVPVFIKPCDWKDAPFGSVQGLPRDAKPVGDPDNDEAWVGVAKGIRDLVDDLLQKGFPVKKTTVRQAPSSNSASTPSKPNNANHLDHILSLIDSADMLAAFDLMDKLDWGNQRGTYNDKKAEWIDPGVGFNKSIFRSQLKTLLKSLFS